MKVYFEKLRKHLDNSDLHGTLQKTTEHFYQTCQSFIKCIEFSITKQCLL